MSRRPRRLLRSVVAGCVLGLAIAQAAAAAPLQKVRQSGTLKVAVYRDFAPWAWRENGVLKGIDVDLGTAIAAKLGVKPEVIDFLADEGVDDDLRNMIWRGPLIGGSAADVMMHVPFDPDFARANDRVAILAPYYREGFAMACARDIDCEVPPPQLKGKRLSAELDSVPDFYLSGSFGGVLRADVTHKLSASAALGSLLAHQSDVVMATRAQIEFALTTPGHEAMVVRKSALPALPSPGWDIGLAVKDDSRDLGDAIEAIVDSMRQDGSLDAILARYGVQPHKPLHL